jgi:hypothetical protein
MRLVRQALLQQVLTKLSCRMRQLWVNVACTLMFWFTVVVQNLSEACQNRFAAAAGRVVVPQACAERRQMMASN